jgi:hypothetical protein
LRCDAAVDLIGLLCRCLLRGCELGLSLVTGLVDLCQLLLGASDPCLQLILATFKVPLFRRKLIPVSRQ